MTGISSGFDASVDIFSPEGRVFQVEYAQKATENSGTLLAIQCVDGIVMAAEQLIHSKLLNTENNTANSRFMTVASHAGIGICGLLSDGKYIGRRCRNECSFYKDLWKEEQPGPVLADSLGDFVHLHTQYWSYRPLGCSVILGVCTPPDSSNQASPPQLYMCDSSGTIHQYRGVALGKGKTIAKSELEKIDGKVTCHEAVKLLRDILHQVHDEQRDPLWKPELQWICKDSNYKFKPVPNSV